MSRTLKTLLVLSALGVSALLGLLGLWLLEVTAREDCSGYNRLSEVQACEERRGQAANDGNFAVPPMAAGAIVAVEPGTDSDLKRFVSFAQSRDDDSVNAELCFSVIRLDGSDRRELTCGKGSFVAMAWLSDNRLELSVDEAAPNNGQFGVQEFGRTYDALTGELLQELRERTVVATYITDDLRTDGGYNEAAYVKTYRQATAQEMMDACTVEVIDKCTDGSPLQSPHISEKRICAIKGTAADYHFSDVVALPGLRYAVIADSEGSLLLCDRNEELPIRRILATDPNRGPVVGILVENSVA